VGWSTQEHRIPDDDRGNKEKKKRRESGGRQGELLHTGYPDLDTPEAKQMKMVKGTTEQLYSIVIYGLKKKETQGWGRWMWPPLCLNLANLVDG